MIGILIITIIGFIFGIILVNLESILDNNIEEIRNLLPGYNCGACGYNGCEDLAKEIDKNPELYKKCRVLRNENLKKMQEYIENTYDIKITETK